MNLNFKSGSEWYLRLTRDTNYRPDIDGLRAIAVLMVVCFHAFPSVLKGGFVGVDIFFVISGYLISTILLRALNQQTYSLWLFYRNRIRRIFPALLTVLIFCLSVGWLLFTAAEFKQLGKHIAAGAGFLSNIVYMSERGYFDISSDLKPLLHLWSLAVEEQFYIVLPPMLWLLYKAQTKALIIIVLITIASFVTALFSISDPTVRFYAPQTRFWELLIGTMIAWYEHDRSKKNVLRIATSQNLQKERINWPNLISIVGVGMLGLSLVLINRQDATPGMWTLLPVVGAALVIIVGMRGWVNSAVLSSRLFVGIGLISYPLYLWHWPLLVLATIVEGTRPSILHRLIAVVIAFLLAIATYVLVERPLRFGGKRNIKVAILVSVMIGVGLLGYTAFREGGYPQRSFALQFKNVSEAIGDWEGGADLMAVTYLGQSFIGNSTQTPEILFFGDSHIEQFMPRIAKLTQDDLFPPSIFFISGGCPPIPHVFEDNLSICRDTFSRAMRILDEPGTIKKIVIGGCWNCYFLSETKHTESHNNKFNYYFQENGGVRHTFRGGLGATLALEQLEKFLQLLSKNYSVYLLLDNPFGFDFAPQNLIGNRLTFQTLDNLTERIRVDEAQVALNDRLKDIARRSGAQSIDQLNSLCPDGKCLRLTPEKKPIYKDEHHLRPFFVKEYADYFERQLLK